MDDKRNTPLRQKDIPSLMDKHHEKIDRAIGYDSDTQQKRLVLFEHNPAKMAAHYPELQKKSEELREENLAVKSTSAAVGWLALASTAVATGYAASKNKISENKLIQGVAVVLSSVTAGLATNFLTDRLLGSKLRKESTELAFASRKAYEQELAVYMEDTERKIATRAINKKLPQILGASEEEDKRWAESMVKKTGEEAINSTNTPIAGNPTPITDADKEQQWAENRLRKVIADAVNSAPQSHTTSVTERKNEPHQIAVV